MEIYSKCFDNAKKYWTFLDINLSNTNHKFKTRSLVIYLLQLVPYLRLLSTIIILFCRLFKVTCSAWIIIFSQQLKINSILCLLFILNPFFYYDIIRLDHCLFNIYINICFAFPLYTKYIFCDIHMIIIHRA